MNTTNNSTGCFNCGEDTDHSVKCHGDWIHTCATPQEIDSEEYGVMMGWNQ